MRYGMRFYAERTEPMAFSYPAKALVEGIKGLEMVKDTLGPLTITGAYRYTFVEQVDQKLPITRS